MVVFARIYNTYEELKQENELAEYNEIEIGFIIPMRNWNLFSSLYL